MYDTGKSIIANCSHLVFNDINIMNSYKKIYLNKQFILVSNKNVIKILSILYNSKVVYTAHECCWPLLDIALFFSQKSHINVRTFSMVGYKKSRFLSYDNISPNSRLRNLVQNIVTFFLKLFFEVFWYISESNKYQLIRNLTIKKTFIRQISVLQNIPNSIGLKPRRNRSIMLIISLLSIDIEEQKNHYKKILKELDKLNYTIYIKNHVRENLKFELEYLDLSQLNNKIEILSFEHPAEFFIDKYSISYVISVASSCLVYPKVVGISTIELLFCDETYKDFRRKNLIDQAKRNEVTLFYAFDWDDLSKLLKN